MKLAEALMERADLQRKLAQLQGEHPLRNLRQEPLQFVKPPRFRQQVVQNQHLPFTADDVRRADRRTRRRLRPVYDEHPGRTGRKHPRIQRGQIRFVGLGRSKPRGRMKGQFRRSQNCFQTAFPCPPRRKCVSPCGARVLCSAANGRTPQSPKTAYVAAPHTLPHGRGRLKKQNPLFRRPLLHPPMPNRT